MALRIDDVYCGGKKVVQALNFCFFNCCLGCKYRYWNQFFSCVAPFAILEKKTVLIDCLLRKGLK